MQPSDAGDVLPKLIYRDPETDQEMSIEVGPGLPEVTIGRNPGNVLRVNNPSISRRHAKIVFEAGECTLYDLDSSNGSYINGNRIRSQHLQDGDPVLLTGQEEGQVLATHRLESRVGALVELGCFTHDCIPQKRALSGRSHPHLDRLIDQGTHIEDQGDGAIAQDGGT